MTRGWYPYDCYERCDHHHHHHHHYVIFITTSFQMITTIPTTAKIELRSISVTFPTTIISILLLQLLESDFHIIAMIAELFFRNQYAHMESFTEG